MKKSIIAVLAAVFCAASVFAETYKIEVITGKNPFNHKEEWKGRK